MDAAKLFSSGSLVVVLIHRSVDTLQAEGRYDIFDDIKSVRQRFHFVISPCAKDIIDLCSARVLVPYTKAHACVVRCTEHLLDMF